MAGPYLFDRVMETTTTTGTGTVTLAGAATGYRTFTSTVGSGNTTFYTIAGQPAKFQVHSPRVWAQGQPAKHQVHSPWNYARPRG